jgi:hypothetical protein
MPYVSTFERYGIEKGFQQGLQLGLQESIVIILSARFGLAGKRLRTRVNEIHIIDALRTLLKACLSAETLQEFRDRLPQRQG